MPAETDALQPHQVHVRDRFICWIEGFDSRHARAWAHRYNDNREAAMCEALFWGVLSDCGVTVAPNANLDDSERAPDFVCYKDGLKFYVEVTCVSTDTVTTHTTLAPEPVDGAQHYRPLNGAIFANVKSKTPQCSNLDSPCILAVGTFHYQASILCISRTFVEWLLTGETEIGFYFDLRQGRAIGGPFQSTQLKSAAFFRPSPLVGIEPARKPISALLVAGFGCKPIQVFGAVHPYPVREFKPALLDRLAFCQVKYDILNASISTEWTQDSDSEGRECIDRANAAAWR